MLEPIVGLVVRYDFLWREEKTAGAESGKDRPCAIVLISAERSNGAKDVLLCAITHTAPGGTETAVRMPARVAKYLGLDERPSWIKTSQVNRLVWEQDRIPYGISRTAKGGWSFGILPQELGRQVFDQVRDKARDQSLRMIDRDEP